MLAAFGVGALAGLGIALPLGAIGVLIVREAVERGIRPAVAAAVAVATVDLGYAALAVLLGRRVTDWLEGYQRIIQLVGAAALVVVVVHGLCGLRRSAARRPGQQAADGDPTTGGSAVTDPTSPAVPTSRVFARFFALTVVNPMTAVYFVALTAGLADRLTGPGAGAAFAFGVFVGSLSWQLVLAIGGALAGSRMTERLRVAVSLTGYGIVALYAVRLALGG